VVEEIPIMSVNIVSQFQSHFCLLAITRLMQQSGLSAIAELLVLTEANV